MRGCNRRGFGGGWCGSGFDCGLGGSRRRGRCGRRHDQLLDQSRIQTCGQLWVFADGATGQGCLDAVPAGECILSQPTGCGLRNARQDGRQIHQQHAEQVDGLRRHGTCLVAACRIFGHDPGLLLVDVLVCQVCQVHDFAHQRGRITRFVQTGQMLAALDEAGVQRSVGQRIGQMTTGTLDKRCAAAGDVDQLADDVGVHAGSEVVEAQVDVFDATGELGRKVVAQRLAGQQLQIAAGSDEGATRLGHLGAVDRQKAVHVNGSGPTQAATVQHGGPEQRVKVADVLANEMMQLGGRLGFPPVVKVQAALGAQRGKGTDVTDGRIEPDIEVLAGCIGYLKAEVRRIARDIPVFESGLEPFGKLGLHRLLQMAVGQPLAQHRLEIAELEEQVI